MWVFWIWPGPGDLASSAGGVIPVKNLVTHIRFGICLKTQSGNKHMSPMDNSWHGWSVLKQLDPYIWLELIWFMFPQNAAGKKLCFYNSPKIYLPLMLEIVPKVHSCCCQTFTLGSSSTAAYTIWIWESWEHAMVERCHLVACVSLHVLPNIFIYVFDAAIAILVYEIFMIPCVMYLYLQVYLYVILAPATLPGYYFVTCASLGALRPWPWDNVWLLRTGIFVSGVAKTKYNVVSLFLERAWYLAYSRGQFTKLFIRSIAISEVIMAKVWNQSYGAYFTAKGYNNRCILAWLSDCLAIAVKKEVPINRYVGAWIQSEVANHSMDWPHHEMLEPSACCLKLWSIRHNFGWLRWLPPLKKNKTHIIPSCPFPLPRDSLNRMFLAMESSGRYLLPGGMDIDIYWYKCLDGFSPSVFSACFSVG